jgi:hypothetical protein
MELEIEPEPTSEERAAIEAALEEQSANGVQPLAYRSAWRNDGLRENALADGTAEVADQWF